MESVLIIFSKGACENPGIKEGQLFFLKITLKGIFWIQNKVFWAFLDA